MINKSTNQLIMDHYGDFLDKESAPKSTNTYRHTSQ